MSWVHYWQHKIMTKLINLQEVNLKQEQKAYSYSKNNILVLLVCFPAVSHKCILSLKIIKINIVILALALYISGDFGCPALYKLPLILQNLYFYCLHFLSMAKWSEWDIVMTFLKVPATTNIRILHSQLSKRTILKFNSSSIALLTMYIS